MNELSPLAKALYSIFDADPKFHNRVGDRFYEEAVPQGASLPGAVFAHQAGNDINGAFGARLATRGLYQVKGICEGDSFAPIEGISDDIDRLLHGLNQYKYETTNADDEPVSITITGVIRTGTLKYSETDADGVRYNHQGGIYRIMTRDSINDANP